MGISSQQAYVLFALGRLYEACDFRFKDTSLTVTLSKKAFIELARKAGMVRKGERALYKNLEELEKKKVLSYANKSLRLTDRGEKRFHELLSRVEPYVAIHSLIQSENPLKFVKVQAKFK